MTNQDEQSPMIDVTTEDSMRLTRLLRAILENDDDAAGRVDSELIRDPRGPAAAVALANGIGGLLIAQLLRQMGRDTLLETLESELLRLMTEALTHSGPPLREK